MGISGLHPRVSQEKRLVRDGVNNAEICGCMSEESGVGRLKRAALLEERKHKLVIRRFFFCLIKSADVPYFPVPPPLDSRGSEQIWWRMREGGVSLNIHTP